MSLLQNIKVIINNIITFTIIIIKLLLGILTLRILYSSEFKLQRQ